MYGRNLIKIYNNLKKLGMCSSERDFDLMLSEKTGRYVWNHRNLGGHARVSPAVVERLRRRLDLVAKIAPPGVARDVRVVIHQIDQDTEVFAALAR